ncbi:MAG: tripartite tricarboxylate transporter substrate binding protein [Burkholderiales bacterium]
MLAHLKLCIVNACRGRKALAEAVALAMAATVSLSHAQGWRPERTVEIVLPSAAGSSLDAAARMTQRILTESRIVTVPVIVVNKPGGGGNISTTYLDQHAGDPHYIYLSVMSLLNNHILGRSKANWDTYTPLAMTFSENMTMVVPQDSPLKTGRDVAAKLKADPQSLSIAIGLARGGTGHLNTALLAKSIGIDPKILKTVQFQGNSQALTALMGGHVDLSSMSFAQAWNQSEAGKLRIVGVAADKRGPGPLANIPTWKEQGYNFEFYNTRFMLGTKGITPEQTAFWDAALKRVLDTKEWQEYATKQHYIPFYVNHKETPKKLAELYQQLKGALTDVGMVK